MAAEESTIGELLDATGGSIKTGPFGTKLKASEYTETGVPVISVGEVGFGSIRIHEKTPRVDETVWSRMPEYLLKSGDIVFGRKGAVERSAQLRAEEDGYFLGSDGIRIRLNGEKCDPRFIAYQLQTESHRNWMIQHAAGTTMPSLNEGIIRRIPIIVRPIGEQKAIANILSAFDDKIELNRRMNATLESMARALFKAWFVDFEPVHANKENRPSTSASPEIAKLFSSDFENGLPKGWSLSPLPKEISFLEGPGLRNWQYRDEGMKFLNIRCIVNGDLDIAKASCIRVEEFQTKYSHFALKEGDIVISTSGTLGRLAIVREDHLPLMLNTSIIRMRGIGPVGLSFVWNYLQSDVFVEEMFAAASGSVQLNFGPVHLKQIRSLRPTDAILKAFEEISADWLHLASRNRQLSQKLAEIRDSLLPRLISGKIRVGEAQN